MNAKEQQRVMILNTGWNAVVREGRASSVPTPVNDVIYAMLKPCQRGNFDKGPGAA